MHLRAHGEVSKFFTELKDAPSNPSLALCTSTILFVLSQVLKSLIFKNYIYCFAYLTVHRTGWTWTWTETPWSWCWTSSTQTAISRRLLKVTGSSPKTSKRWTFVKTTCFSTKPSKVIDICTEMKAAGHAGSLNIDLLSADHLAMETLLRFETKL